MDTLTAGTTVNIATRPTYESHAVFTGNTKPCCDLCNVTMYEVEQNGTLRWVFKISPIAT